MRRLLAVLPFFFMAAAPPTHAPPPPGPGLVRLRMETSLGAIVVDVDVRHAPITAKNFIAYADEHRFDGASFYRAAPSKTDPARGFVQGGINHDATKAKWPIEHEPTTVTGLHHVDGTLSMARNDPGTAAGDFTICVGDQRFLDARPGFPGYAAFGHVVTGMDVVRRMLPLPKWPGGFSRETMGQILRSPVRIINVRRVPAT